MEFERVTKTFFEQKDEFDRYWHSAESEINQKKQRLKDLDREFHSHEKKLKQASEMSVKRQAEMDW